MLRVIAIVLSLAGVLMLGAVQLASSAAYGDLAVPASLPHVLHAASPMLLRQFVGGPLARAQADVHNHDTQDAWHIIWRLPYDASVGDLLGRMSEMRGEREAAASEYISAEDAVRAQPIIDKVAATDVYRALRLEKALALRLTGDPAAGEVTGQAYWRWGQLAAEYAADMRVARPPHWDTRALASEHLAETLYERALSYAPNEETYLLAAGYQSLANGDVDASARFYAHAAEVVPNSADAYGGLAWTSAARGDCVTARAQLARSRALRTTVVRDPADDPLVGAPLRRCAP
jgi:tetratricopeptide (TPR) repeat protein